MQLYLTLAGDRIILPINNRPLIHGLIYKALSADAEAFERIHDARPAAGERLFKGFSFSDLKGKYTIQERSLVYTDTVSLEIRSIDPILIALLYHYFCVVSEASIGSALLQVAECRMADVHIRGNRILARSVSPVIAYQTGEDRHTRFYSPADDAFYELVTGNAERKARKFAPDAPFDFSVSLSPAARVKKQLSSFKGTILEGWYGEFLLQGEPRILDMLYQTGIGAKNPEGYGLFECVQLEAGGVL